MSLGNSVNKVESDVELLRENRTLRKKVCQRKIRRFAQYDKRGMEIKCSYCDLKVEGLMGHNMQLMLTIKETEAKYQKQKRLLLKYRKAYALSVFFFASLIHFLE